MRKMTLRELPAIETGLLSGRLTVSFAAEAPLGIHHRQATATY